MSFESVSSSDVVAHSIDILKKVYKIARKKEDTTLMLAIADRLMLLYESMSDIEKSKKQHPAGFRLSVGEDDDRD